jgi:hypothetical protein
LEPVKRLSKFQYSVHKINFQTLAAYLTLSNWSNLKFKAFILFICFVVYFFDTLSAASHFKMKETKSSCCKKMMAKHKMPSKCPSKSKDCTSDCFNCPLTYVVTLTPAVSLTVSSVPFQNNFFFYSTSFESQYCSKAWKPPRTISC